MKTNDADIRELIKYIDGQLNLAEKKQFEEKLKESRYLQAKLVEIKNTLNSLDKNISPQVNNLYFNNLVPRFRESLPQGRNRRKDFKKIIYSTAAALIIILIGVFYYQNFNSGNSIQNEISGLKLSEISGLSETDLLNVNDIISGDYTYADSLINLMIDNELNLDEDNLYSVIYKDLDVNDIIINMSAEELNSTYNRLINKKF